MENRALKAIVSIEVADQGLSIGWLYREKPDRDDDSGWRVFSGAEPDDFANDASSFVILSLEELLALDPALEAVLDAPYLVTSPGDWWVQWAALGIGIAWVISLFRVLGAIVVAGGLAALYAHLRRH